MNSIHKNILGTLLTGAMLCMSAPASAYQFSEMCAPTTNHDTTVGTPDVVVVVDVSGSMGEQGGGGKTKIQIARESITELATAVGKPGPCTAMNATSCDQVRLGLGYFSNDSNIDVKPGEDSYIQVKSKVATYVPTNGTYMGQAAKKLAASTELANASRIGVGVLITDGEPSSKSTVERTMYHYCEMRDRTKPVVNYAVGFGAGADPRTNSLFAAAGGTGECCAGSSCTYQPSQLRDPCALSKRSDDRKNADSWLNSNGSLKSGFNCRGQLQADNAQALKDTLLGLVNDLACTFPLEVPAGYVAGEGADADPAGTRVEFYNATWDTTVRVPAYDMSNPNQLYTDLVNVYGIAAADADPYKGDGWFFADTTRKAVRMTDQLCDLFKTTAVSTVQTQVACLCENTGESCDVPCGQDPDAGCEEDANGNMVQAGRCKPGVVECNFGVEYCQKFYSPQPEICNGLDDNCDGSADNMETADPAQNDDIPGDGPGREFSEWDQNQSALDSRGISNGFFCGYSSACGCTQPHPLDDMPTGTSAEWESLLDIYAANKSLCTCIDSLAPGSAQDFDAQPDDASSDDVAVCTVSAVHPSAPGAGFVLLGLIALLGMVNVRRERRKS